MDCVINALQLMNVLDETAANIMRISTLGMFGFTKEQIEVIFMYKAGHNFSFVPTMNYQEWSTRITTLLPPGNVVFAGYETQTGSKHVFLIGRFANGRLVYIDPQRPPMCLLDSPACERNVNGEGQRSWYLLFHSTIPLTTANTDTLIAYTQALQRQGRP
uniref:Peptidase C39-like domain-containing protein n=1 Tax=viral metagenome TaxID=1070528 RepID=A0A6C0JWP0_9ZZZZ